MATRAALNFSGPSTVQVVTERAERVIEWMHLILVSHMVTAPVDSWVYTAFLSGQLGSTRVRSGLPVDLRSYPTFSVTSCRCLLGFSSPAM